MHLSNYKMYIGHMYSIHSVVLACSFQNDKDDYNGCIRNNPPHTSILFFKRVKPFHDCWGSGLELCLIIL